MRTISVQNDATTGSAESATSMTSAPPSGHGDQAETPSRLPAFLQKIALYDAEFIVYDDGYRGWTYRYPDIARMAWAFVARLRESGVRKGDTVMIWSESRPGWIAALWGCLLEGAVLVPVDPQSSLDLFHRIEQKVKPRLILLGGRVPTVNGTVWSLSDIEQGSGEAPDELPEMSADDIAEIVFTSGTTAEPKGVIITHRNLAANLKPMEDQLAPYVKFVRPFFPLRILNLLPMSHLFGQALATFVPPLIPASVVFMSSASAQEIARQIRTRRVTVAVSVPKVLEVLREFIVHRFPQAADAAKARGWWLWRWWRFRKVHRLFGWKFCCVVAGGAPLGPDLEEFWRGLGFVVVQGYGLTETAPIVSFNHPFHVHPGTTGEPLAGVEVEIADDGEVLVRGDNVTRGYFEAPQETAAALRDGWFHTGDIGELDPEGHLIIRGRKKEMIVTPEGLKVFPEDVEAVLNQIPGVRDSAVIGVDRVHAVLALESGVHAEQVVQQANARLEEHQKIRSFTIWTGGALPRTATTRKLRRTEIAKTVTQGQVANPDSEGTELLDIVQKYAPGRGITPATTLDELGLSSLDRVELMMDLEEKLETSIDETAFATVTKVGDLTRPMGASELMRFPTYNRTGVAKLIRRFSLATILLPITRRWARAKVSGLENLQSIRGPVIFASNHQSHLDTPVILAALPARLRYGLAPVMWKEYFDAHFHPDRYSLWARSGNSIVYRLVTLLFNAFPVPQTESGGRQSIRYMGELVEQGWSILIFPEGERTVTGEIGRFYPGVGMIASRLRLPVIPIRLVGVDRVLHRTAKWPHPGPVEIRIGRPILLTGESYAALARQVEDAVKAL